MIERYSWKAVENPEINCAVMGYDDNVMVSSVKNLWDGKKFWPLRINIWKAILKEQERRQWRIIPADMGWFEKRIEDLAKESFMALIVVEIQNRLFIR